MSVAAQTLLAIALLAAGVAKLRNPRRAADALATYGIERAPLRHAVLALLAGAEAVIAVALVAQAGWARAAAAALLALFAAGAAGALAAGRAGRPCACFGAGSRLHRGTPLQALAGAALALVLAEGWLGRVPSGYERWLTMGLTVTVLACAGLALVVLALAREVGVLRLSIAGQGALEIPEEGPPVGERQAWADALPFSAGALLGLAVFSSEACPMCRRLEPAVRYVAADPLLAVRVFDEGADASTWAAAAVPGSPYAVALDRSGVTLAKGTFNSLVQLESIVATARAREAELVLAV